MDGGGASVEPGKIFVGGLSWETTKEGLKTHFEQFGAVEDCVIMVDPVTKRPRGFGFVTFKDPTCVHAVCNHPEHMLDNKKVDPKPATLKTETPAPAGAQATTKKVFVGGISSQTKEDDIRAHFSQYGKVTEVDLKFDKATQRMRGFGFVGFESEEIVEQVCQTRFHQLNGKTVEVKKAEPRYATASATGSPYASNMQYGNPTAAGANYGGYGRGGAGYSPYSGYGYGYGSAAPQQQQQQAQQYGAYGYGGASGYGNQSYQFGGQGGTYTAGTDRSYYTGTQTGTGGQQQMSYGQDNSAYARNYTTGTDGYSSAAHSTAGYTGYENQAAAASYQQYTDSQAANYGRGMAQQRGVSSYQPYGSH